MVQKGKVRKVVVVMSSNCQPAAEGSVLRRGHGFQSPVQRAYNSNMGVWIMETGSEGITARTKSRKCFTNTFSPYCLMWL